MDTTIKSLGDCRFVSPLRHIGGMEVSFKTDDERVLVNHSLQHPDAPRDGLMFEQAGPREQLFFDPPRTTAAIVTCGGLCPGLNDIIRAIVFQCHYRYGVTRTYGFRYG